MVLCSVSTTLRMSSSSAALLPMTWTSCGVTASWIIAALRLSSTASVIESTWSVMSNSDLIAQHMGMSAQCGSQ
ncbi:Uncharacterised protein [Mycobacteroides abscessus subsp. massiliense]|nr:Uncharacterised protein [Mycobacteroides abscessus subsp. massiliense]